MKREYNPPLSVQDFVTCEAFIPLICGPIGSTKTTAGIMKIAYHALRMAKCTDGIRRSRCIWVRNTREQLRDTSVPDFLKWYPDGIAGTYAKTEYKFKLVVGDAECEVLFRGLDDANDVRRLLSLQASFAVLDEFREINPEIFDALQGRLGRYPDGMMVPHRAEWGIDKKGNPIQGCVTDEGKSNAHIWGMSNPPDMETFWEDYLTNPPNNARVFFQPGGLDPAADWIQHLPSGYYENLAEGKKPEWVDVYINAKFGKSLSGQPVFRSFNYDIHVAKTPLNYIKMATHPLLIGMDFGLTPACTINQVDTQGRLLTFSSLASEGMGILRFSREKLKPLLASRFPGMQVLVIGDPAGQQRAQTDERSTFDILRQEGFRVIPARSNTLVDRISGVDKWLTRLVDGKPAHLFDPSAKEIITAMRGGYRYKLRTNGEVEDTPDKKSKHSHVSDAHQYVCMHADGNATGASWKTKARPILKPPAAWG